MAERTRERIPAEQFFSRRNDLVSQGFEVTEVRFIGSDVEFCWNGVRIEFNESRETNTVQEPVENVPESSWRDTLRKFLGKE